MITILCKWWSSDPQNIKHCLLQGPKIRRVKESRRIKRLSLMLRSQKCSYCRKGFHPKDAYIKKHAMFKFYNTFSFRNDLRIISHLGGNAFIVVQGWEGFFCFHHMISSSRVYQERFGIRNNFHEGMSSFLLDVPIIIISLPNTLWKIDIVPLEGKIHFINIFLHVGIFRVKSFPEIGTLLASEHKT